MNNNTFAVHYYVAFDSNIQWWVSPRVQEIADVCNGNKYPYLL